MSTKSEIEEAEPPYLSGPANQQGGQQIVQQFNIEDHALLREINNIKDNLSDMSSLVNQEGGKQFVQQFIPFVSYHSDIHSMSNDFNAEIRKLNKTLSQSQLQQKPSINQSTLEERQELSALEILIIKDPIMKTFQGLISTEEKGEEIFEELLKFELIIPYGNGKNPFVSKCRIHPWIRYLLISLAKDAVLLNYDSNRVPRFDIKNSRRACLVADDENLPETERRPSLMPDLGTDDENNLNRSTSISHMSESEKDLRTIFNVNQSYVSFKSKLLGNQERLAVLMLGRWQDQSTHHIEVENEEWLKELRTQKHLKYLSLRGISRITALPDSILELTCLEILDLKACHNLETLPDDISPLKKLTHFDVSECYLLESMPKGIDKLTSLEVLKGFVIGNSKKTPCGIDDLRKLEKLKRLSIHIGSEAVIQQGEIQKLKGLESVTHLKISWGTHKDQIVKESFSFPPKLDKLDFEGFPHRKLPDWFRPSNLKELKKLYIKGGELTGLYHEKEGPWKEEILRLHYLNNLKFEKEKFKNFFPSLRYVQEISRKKENKGEIKDSEWSEKDLE